MAKRTVRPLESFRPMTRDEILALYRGQRVWFWARDNQARKLTINGAVKTWKRDPARIEVPVKYGLYETARFTGSDLTRLMVPDGWEE